jgi:Raf kinase inhibitor-like YbhB/YbcL family protein
MANGAVHGTNDYQKRAYRGPCPPDGIHRYVVKLYALDSELDFGSGATKEELLKAMNGHILDQVELVGKYRRQK